MEPNVWIVSDNNFGKEECGRDLERMSVGVCVCVCASVWVREGKREIKRESVCVRETERVRERETEREREICLRVCAINYGS